MLNNPERPVPVLKRPELRPLVVAVLRGPGMPVFPKPDMRPLASGWPLAVLPNPEIFDGLLPLAVFPKPEMEVPVLPKPELIIPRLMVLQKAQPRIKPRILA